MGSKVRMREIFGRGTGSEMKMRMGRVLGGMTESMGLKKDRTTESVGLKKEAPGSMSIIK